LCLPFSHRPFFCFNPFVKLFLNGRQNIGQISRNSPNILPWCVPKITVWVYFLRPCNWKFWYSLG
jgi:hypothetical protein